MSIIAVVVLGVLSWTIAIASSGQIKNSELRFSSDQAYYTAMAGLEFALMQVKNNQSIDMAGQSFAGGEFSYSGSGRDLEVTGTRAHGEASHGLDTDGLGQSACLIINTSTVGTGVPSNPQDHRAILNITATNNCSSPVTLDQIYIATSNNGKRLQSIEIDGTSVASYSGAGMSLPGTSDITDVTINGGTTVPIDWIEFNGNMRTLDVDLQFIVSDSATRTVRLEDLEPAS